MSKITLDCLKKGKSARIISVNNTGSIRRRLLDIGIVPDSIITSYLESPFKDPVAYIIKMLLLRLEKVIQ